MSKDILRNPGNYYDYSKVRLAKKGHSKKEVAAVVLTSLSVVAAALGLNELINQEHQQKISAWQQNITDKLDGRTKLGPDERIIEKMVTSPSGINFEQRSAMQTKKTPIIIRAYPTDEKIIGRIAQGIIVYKVILTNDTPFLGLRGGSASFKCGSVNGPILNEQGQPVKVDPKKICTASGDFLEIPSQK
ncbi:MAG: hypothetical protein Q8P80_03175 [Candidatus Levybacteria bacterium]|nr:hypothetical protein [Candidatus Levybacteria bacterium]